MKNIFYTLALLVCFSSFGQITILTDNMIYEKYPEGIASYYDKDGNSLFEGAANWENISDFINHPDFNKIDYYSEINFEGELLNSNAVIHKYYCDSNGNPTSIRNIFFKDENGIMIGTEITYNRWGKIVEFIHH